ncbi:photosystem II 5 kDa protein, chloroplastic-like [Silene latifolia]|uniref:photosystem II 5 kDa protein, chloroplastic-like n=1 Tax=Silene latifolia TaxID=37657 RepID=UPI003D787A2D
MASASMAASFLGVGGASACPRRAVITNSAQPKIVQQVRFEKKGEAENNNGRREVVFAAITATICSVAGLALADEPKRGTPEAKKAYGPVCVANPTARICNY